MSSSLENVVSNNSQQKDNTSKRDVVFRFLTATLEHMAKSSTKPSEIYQILSQTGCVLLLQDEKFPELFKNYIENKFQQISSLKEDSLKIFQLKYQHGLLLFNFCTFLQNVKLPAILPFKVPLLTPDQQNKQDNKIIKNDNPQFIKQFDYNHFQEISICGLEELLQSKDSPFQMSDYQKTNSNKIPQQVLKDPKYQLSIAKIQLQLASLYLQRVYHPNEIHKEKDQLKVTPPFYFYNHENTKTNEDIALFYLKKSLKYINIENSKEDFAVANSNLGHVLKRKKRYDEALEAFEKVLLVRKESDKDHTKYISNSMNISNTYLAKVEEEWSEEKLKDEKLKLNILLSLNLDYSIFYRRTREFVKINQQKAKNWIECINKAIDMFGKCLLKIQPTQQQSNEKSNANNQYIGLLQMNMGYAYLLKTKILVQILQNLEEASESAQKGIEILQKSLEIIKPEIKEKDDFYQQAKTMGSENFPKLNIHLAELLLYMQFIDEKLGIEHLTTNKEVNIEKSNNMPTNLEEAKSCLELGASLFIKQSEMKEWYTKLKYLLHEVYAIYGQREEKEETKEEYLEKSKLLLKELLTEKVKDINEAEDVEGLINRQFENLQI
ncbi:hypothetical protein ABK040_014744 [Willaertia magna]